jgi:hypothetical protein
MKKEEGQGKTPTRLTKEIARLLAEWGNGDKEFLHLAQMEFNGRLMVKLLWKEIVRARMMARVLRESAFIQELPAVLSQLHREYEDSVSSLMEWKKRIAGKTPSEVRTMIEDEAEKRQEKQVRRLLARQGMALHKSRKPESADNRGGYMVINRGANVAIAGARFDLTLDQAAKLAS